MIRGRVFLQGEVHAVDRRAVKQLLEFMLAKALARSVEQWQDISLVLTTDAGIRPINRIHLQSDDTTDVITYTYPALPGQDGGTAGEIFVNVDLAARQGLRYGSVARELALYIAHGCDHLSGEDDTTPVQRRRMRRRELRWVAEACDLGLLGSVFAR